MKQITVLFLFLFGMAISYSTAQDYCMKAPVGYAGSVTGGAGGSVTTVATASDLQSALTKSGKGIIVVTKDITLGSGAMIKAKVTDKTLLGVKGVKLKSTARVKDGGILQLSAGSKNVIIRNLIFEGPGAYDVDGNDLLFNRGTNIWVDHCEFYDGVDGNFDNSNEADNVTISWCKFGYKIAPKAGGSGGSADHRFTNLIGGSSSTYPSDGRYSITFQYCYWSDGCRERMPRARNAQLHILNCYYNTNASSSKALGLGAGSKGTVCYVEGTDFENVKTVLDATYDKVSGQSVSVKFVDCNKGGKDQGSVSKPSYSYTALPVAQVKAAVTGSCGSGATLTVTTAGAVSSSCSGGVTPTPDPEPTPDPISVPTNVKASSTTNSITVTWSSVSNATGYKVKVGSKEYTVGKVTTYTASGLTANTSYTYQVKAIASSGESNYSSSKSIQTLAENTPTPTPDPNPPVIVSGTESFEGLTSSVLATGSDKTQDFTLNNLVWKVEKARLSTDNTYAAEGSNSIRLLHRAGALITPVLKGKQTFSFYVRGAKAKATTIEVYISTDGGATFKSTAIWKEEITSDVYAKKSITLNESSNNVVLKIANKGNATSSSSDYNCYIDAISFEANVGTPTAIQDNLEQSAIRVLRSGDEWIVEGVEVAEISIYSISGQKLQSVFGTPQISIASLNQGVYILWVKTVDGEVIKKKIIK